jgi:hypothetical protein
MFFQWFLFWQISTSHLNQKIDISTFYIQGYKALEMKQ